MRKLTVFIASVLLFSCGGEENTEEDVVAMEISTEEIDRYVEDKNGSDQEYDVSQSLRFSSEKETYEVANFVQNDTTVLYQETITTDDEQILRMTYYENGLPVYISEIIASNVRELPFTERKIYLNGKDVIEAYERQAAKEFDLEFVEYSEIDVILEAYDIDRPVNALAQQGEFEMTFQEFLIIDPQTFLILESKTSDFDVALFVADEHPLIMKIRANEEEYVGKTVFVTHQFIMTNNIERMLFIDGYLPEEGIPEGFNEVELAE